MTKILYEIAQILFTHKRSTRPNVASLFRWKNKLEPSLTRNKPATKVDMSLLKEDIEKFPDDYQWGRAKRLNVTQPAIHYALKRLNISFKKKR